jgi:iron(III) transport system substrate-binding protein
MRARMNKPHGWLRTTGIGALVAVMVLVDACSAGSSGADRSSSSSALGSVSLTSPDLVGTAGPSSAPSVAGQTITVYSGQHEQTTQALVADFQKRSGVAVRLKSDDESSLAGQLLQEGSASPADVFFAENPPALTRLQENSLLIPVDASTLAQVPKDASSAAGDWVGVSARAVAFATNNSVAASSLPASVMDLAGPAWKGKLGIAPSETDFSPIITAIIRDKGTDAAKAWLEGLKANGKIFEDNETLIAAIDKGEVQGGLVDHYYWYRLRDEVGASKVDSALHYFPAGDPGALVDVSGAAVLKSSSHVAAAQAFLAYLVSAPAQQIIADSHSYEYPLRPGVESAANLPSMGAIVSPSDLGDGKPALLLLQDVGLL